MVRKELRVGASAHEGSDRAPVVIPSAARNLLFRIEAIDRALSRLYAWAGFERIFSDESDSILSVRLYGPLPLAEERQSRGAIAGGRLNI